MKTLKDQVKELTENQKHILEAIKYLNEMLERNLENVNDEQIKDVNDILESQAMIDQLVGKNSDDIIAIIKRKDENRLAIETLEAKIEVMVKEIGETLESIEAKIDQTSNKDKVPENGIDDKSENGVREIACKYYNRGFCK
jgi:phage terminase small subunit